MPRKHEPSFGLKQIIWDIAASVGTNNFSAIYREVHEKLRQLHKKEELYGDETPDIRTLHRIIEIDINRLPPEVVVAKLPRYVWHFRSDYEAIERLAAGIKAKQEATTEAEIKQEPYEETPHKQEESLIVHGLSPGATDVEFLVTNVSNNLLVVDRVCVEVMHWEQYDARLTTGARIIDYKYKVKIKPNFIGEILVRTSKFKYAKGDVDSFSISFISPPGNKYILRINFYCSLPETGKRFAVSTDKFEIRFHKHRIFSGEGTSSIHNAIAQVQKLLDEAKRKK